MSYPCECQDIYTVQSGDSMYSIAQAYGVPLQRLIDCNPQIPNPHVIHPGQQLCIPYSYPCACQDIYTVQSGDSMYSIAQAYGVPLQSLIDCNPQVTDPHSIHPGQQLCIPYC